MFARDYKSNRKSGTLSLEEIRESENERIMAAHKELKQDKNYQQLVSKFGLDQRRQRGPCKIQRTT